MLFVDGIGLGPCKPESNPFCADLPGFEALSGGLRWVSGSSVNEPHRLFRAIDANLGLEGLPQSGTGQATLFTGINCAQLAGRHYGPYPHSATRKALRESSIFQRVGPERCAFANAYPPRFFAWVERMKRWPVTTRACLDAGVQIRTIEDLEAGRGIAADVTGRGLARHLGLAVTEVSPAEAANRLLGLAETHAFTLFEVFHTDKAGHAQDRELAARILSPLDGLLQALVEQRGEGLTIVLTSDHGNLEDLSVKTHTRHPVPLAVLGPGAPSFASVTDLTGVTPAIAELLG